MTFLPQGIAELDPNIPWATEVHLRLIEEVVCSPQASGTSAPGMEEAEERTRQVVERRDREAEDAAIVDRMTVEVREFCQDSPARRSSHRICSPAAAPQLQLPVRVRHFRQDIAAYGGRQRFEEGAHGGQRSLVPTDEVPVGVHLREVGTPWASADDGDVALLHAHGPCWAGALVVESDIYVQLLRPLGSTGSLAINPAPGEQ